MTDHHLTTPLSAEDISQLHIGDRVYLSGVIVTARDKAHMYLVEGSDMNLSGGVIYHCGPIVKKEGESYSIISAGPTTSARMELYEADVISQYGVRAVVGKGGMGPKTLGALQEYGAVYLSALGGTGVLSAESIAKVIEVKKLEFGTPEALWVLEVKDFPCIVAMDSHGKSLYKKIEDESKRIMEEIK